MYINPSRTVFTNNYTLFVVKLSEVSTVLFDLNLVFLDWKSSFADGGGFSAIVGATKAGSLSFKGTSRTTLSPVHSATAGSCLLEQGCTRKLCLPSPPLNFIPLYADYNICVTLLCPCLCVGSWLIEMIIPINSYQLLSSLEHFITARGKIRNILLNLSLNYTL